jgi:hypothetical protein
MLDFLDKDSPDERRFSILKAIFLGAATEEQSTRDSVLPQQYMSLCRTLSSGEVLVLQAVFAITEGGGIFSAKNNKEWFEIIAEKSGLKTRELVEIHERKLMEKNLIMNKAQPDGAMSYQAGSNFRLTPLAVQMCKFIKTFDYKSATWNKKD